MILRIDRVAAELPPPSDPDPAGAAIVQELMGGKYGEMSTFMNYTYQSFNFRNRQGARPFYDLVANIAAEEFGHIEIVSAAINTMLTDLRGPRPKTEAPTHDRPRAREPRIPQQFIAGGRATLPTDSMGNPWNGDYVHSSGDLVEDLTHNFFLETGARNNKLKVYEMVDHPVARRSPATSSSAAASHQVAYARAIEKLTGVGLDEDVPDAHGSPRRRSPSASLTSRRGDHLKLYRFSLSDYLELAAVFNGPHPETGEELEVDRTRRRRAFRRSTSLSQPDVFAPDYAPEEIAEIATRSSA